MSGKHPRYDFVKTILSPAFASVEKKDGPWKREGGAPSPWFRDILRSTIHHDRFQHVQGLRALAHHVQDMRAEGGTLD